VTDTAELSARERSQPEPAHRLSTLDAAIARGIANAEAGRVQGIAEVRAELREPIATLERSP
jgi:predicted transcriptional regulator